MSAYIDPQISVRTDPSWTEQCFYGREALLAWKIEASLSKDEIFELYVNQIFLDQRADGFAAAIAGMNQALLDLAHFARRLWRRLAQAPERLEQSLVTGRGHRGQRAWQAQLAEPGERLVGEPRECLELDVVEARAG